MIRVHKPAAPAVLLSDGQREAQNLCDAFDADPAPFRRPGIEFNRELYAHATVKEALLRAQHGKCAFCESHVRHISHGDVEHYRPKAAVAQNDGDPLERPGYYWLAYHWDNLFFCCQLCNQRFKRNLFPLRQPHRRARSHHEDVSREQPLVIDPAGVDPARHIGFHKEVAFPVRRSKVGRTTIDVLGINRVELIEKRRTYLEQVELSHRMLLALRSRRRSGSLSPDEAQLLTDLEQALLRRQEDKAEYASMVRSCLR